MPLASGRRNVSIPNSLWERLHKVSTADGDANRSHHLRRALEHYLPIEERRLAKEGKLEPGVRVPFKLAK